MKKQMRFAGVALLAALMLALAPTFALAENDSDALALDGAGNAFADESGAVGMTIAGDLYCFGQNVDASNAQIDASAILAGQTVTVNGTRLGGSLRAAGYQISAENTVVDVNATLAAYGIHLGSQFSARAVYAAAQNVTFAGTCQTLGVSAQSVVISGTISGDVNITAGTVTVTDTAVISGNLNVTAKDAPSVASGASVANINFTESETEETGHQLAAAATAVGVLAKLGSLLMMLPGRILLAVLYYFIIRKSLDEAADMIQTRPAAMPISGLVALICVPVLAIILMFTYVGVPLGMLLACLYALALAFAVSFAGCMLGRCVFSKLHTLLAYLIGVSALSLIKLIPVVGGVVTFACMLYTLGYFIQKIYLGFGKGHASGVSGSTPDPTEEPAQRTQSEAL